MRESHDWEYIKNLLERENFTDFKRLKRFVMRKNIRKFTAPFHFYGDNKYSRLFYGDGWVDLIVKKSNQ
jgi:hypothetical protein